jgi:FtsZ-binding cell division protein ZapB
MATSPTKSKAGGWRSAGVILGVLVLAVVLFFLAMQIVILKGTNQQLSSSLASAQAQNAKLQASNDSLAATGGQFASQDVALKAQVAALQSQLGTVLGDERVGQSFFESFLGLQDGTSQHENCSSARFLNTTAKQQQCAYVESYYAQIDAIALPYIGK